MKKEKLEEIIKHQKNIISDLEDTIIKYDVEINRIHRKNIELQKIIDEAIKYIEDFELNNCKYDYINHEKILKILEGGSNE